MPGTIINRPQNVMEVSDYQDVMDSNEWSDARYSDGTGAICKPVSSGQGQQRN
jgi:hypothetical protein